MRRLATAAALLPAGCAALPQPPLAEPRAHRQAAFVEHFDVLRTHVAVGERSGGLAKLRIVPLHRRASSRVEAQEPAHTMSLAMSRLRATAQSQAFVRSQIGVKH